MLKPLNNVNWRTAPVKDPFRDVTEKEDIVIDRKYSRVSEDVWPKKPHTFYEFERHIVYPRVVPFYSGIPSNILYCGKARGKDAASVHFNIDQGLLLRYRGRKWFSDTNIYIDFSYKQMRELIQEFTKTLKRHAQRKN